DKAVMLDGSHLGDGQLLLTHRLGERGVVARYGQQLRAVEYGVARRAVEDHLPARGDSDRHTGDAHHPITWDGHEVAGPVGIPGQMAKQPRHGQVLAEPLDYRFIVA